MAWGVPVPRNGRGGAHSLLELVVDTAAGALDLVDHDAALLDLLAHKLDGALEDEALGAALALEARDELRQAVETLADGLATLLLCAVCARAPSVSFAGSGSEAHDKTKPKPPVPRRARQGPRAL